MKRNEQYLLKTVADSHVVVPVGKAADAFPGMVNLNATGAYLWELLEQEQTVDSLAEALVTRYAIGKEQAVADVQAYLSGLLKIGAVLA